MFKKLVLFLLFCTSSSLLRAQPAQGQFVSATIAIDGLTCSMCSKGVKHALEKLPFVKMVTVDLDKTTAYVAFQASSTVSLLDLATQVNKAGFSVRTLSVSILQGQWVDTHTLQVGKQTLIVLNAANVQAGERCVVQVVDKHFSDPKPYHTYQGQIQQLSRSLAQPETYLFVYL